MGVKEFIPILNKKTMAIIASLIVIICIIFMLNNTGYSEDTRSVEKMNVNFIQNDNNCNYTIWSKTVVSSNGWPILKTDAYNTAVISVTTGNSTYWIPGYKSWSTNLYFMGMGATRSGIGSNYINGCRALALDTNTSNVDVAMVFGLNLNNSNTVDNLSRMASFATENLSSTSWPNYELRIFKDSYKYAVPYKVNSLTDPYTHDGVYFTQKGRWQYGNALFSSITDCLYPIEFYLYLLPNSTGKICFINTLSWGSNGTCKNEMNIIFKLPPDPDTLSQEELDRYGITKRTYPNGYYEYYINNLTCYIT